MISPQPDRRQTVLRRRRAGYAARLPFSHRILNLIAVLLPCVGFIVAMALMWDRGFGWLELALLIGMYLATGLGVTVGFHRFFAHRSFETGRIMQAVSNNVPGLLEEMWPSMDQQLRFAQSGVNFPNVGGVLSCNGPLLNRSIQIFGAKLGLALHYTTTGRTIPPAGGVVLRWFSNFDAVTDEIPPELLKILGPPISLRQGTWGVEDQFEYAFAVPEEANMCAYFSTFRRSFAILSWVSDRMAKDLRNVEKYAHILAPLMRRTTVPSAVSNARCWPEYISPRSTSQR